MTDLVVWAGPVSKYAVPDATVPGARELFVSCRGDQTSKYRWCPGEGTRFRPDPELIVDAAGLQPGTLSRLFLGGFSAGGSTHKRLLTNPAYRRLTKALMLSDATYTAAWVDPQKRVPPVDPGFVEYALDVLRDGDKMFVATASPIPNFKWASGVENLQALRAAIEKRSGKRFQRLDHFFGIEPAPKDAYRLGNVIFAEYPYQPLGHHHYRIASDVWQRVLLPWLAQPTPAPPDPPNGDRRGRESPEQGAHPGWLLAGAAVGWAAVEVVRRIRAVVR